MGFTLSGQEFEQEYERLVKIIHSDRYYDCIVHHSATQISEKNLIDEIHNCGKPAPAFPTREPKPYIEDLEKEGVLDRFMIPTQKGWHYELTPLGKYSLKKMLDTYGEKFEHPDLNVMLNVHS